MTGGNADTLPLMLITLHMLQELNNTLPIEIWALPGEISPENKDLLESLGATTRHFGEPGLLVRVKEIKGRQKNFQIKVAAWANSGFEEIIALDSDSMPVRPVEYLFDTEEYLSTGQIFWPDWWKTHPGTRKRKLANVDNPVWELFDIPCEDEWEQESGQLVINKRKNWEFPPFLGHKSDY
jgi:alpha 1,2-mannosyltransferase